MDGLYINVWIIYKQSIDYLKHNIHYLVNNELFYVNNEKINIFLHKQYFYKWRPIGFC